MGGGLAGASSAAILARAHVRVHLLERDAEPRDKICGEFLSIEAQRYLAALGLDLSRLGGASISHLRLISGARSVAATLPFTALGLTRRRLDEALMTHAGRQGAKIDRGVGVRSLGDHSLQTSAGALPFTTLLLASGKHDIRGAKRETAGALDRFIGFKMYFEVEPPVRAALAGWIEVVLFDGGYAGLQLVENGVANLCLLVREDRFAHLGRSWDALFEALQCEPHLARRLGGARPLLSRPLSISGVPYGFLHQPSDADPPGVFRLGDQGAVIPSFCGDGMAIALHSGRLAANAVIAGGDSRSYHDQLLDDVAGQVRMATRLQRFGEASFGRGAVMQGSRLMPQLLTYAARFTRIPSRALRRAIGQ